MILQQLQKTLPGAVVVVAVGYFDGGGAIGGRGALAPAPAVEGLRRRRVLEGRFKRNNFNLKLEILSHSLVLPGSPAVCELGFESFGAAQAGPYYKLKTT